jgi:coenzyme F420-reducing hydrogenase alpha subunit
MPHGGANDLNGTITVRMGVRDACVAAVDVVSTRLADASKVFVGRTPAQAAQMVGMLYSLCARAQTVAALEALEQAQEITLAPQHTSARNVMRLAEMLSQTALRLCMDWPRLLRLPPEPVVVRACLGAEAALERALFADAPWKTPGGASFSPDVQAALDQIASLNSLIATTVLRDDGDGLAEQLRRAVSCVHLQSFGALSDEAKREDGALIRRWNDARVREARDVYGLGLRARLEARLADMTALLQEMAEVAQGLKSGKAFDQKVRDSGVGEARVQTARGMLTHSVTVKDGLIAEYVIDAPTDVNFAPDGPVAMGLLGADATDSGTLMCAAELHVLAIDPCVRFAVEIRHA